MPAHTATTDFSTPHLTVQFRGDITPGSWVVDAQQALDELAMCTSLEDVVARCGSARRLAVRTLGLPAGGGSATKPVIAALGRLLHHGLGPAVAAEALALASVVSGLISPDGLAEFFTVAAGAQCAHRPIRLDDPCIRVGIESLPARRRLVAVLDLWAQNRTDVTPVEESCALSYLDDPLTWLFEIMDRASYLASGADVDRFLSVLLRADPVDSVGAVVAAEDSMVRGLARNPALFDLHETVVAAVVRRAPSAVLAHPQCPSILRQRLARPTTIAELDLALQARIVDFDRSCVVGLLAHVEDGVLADLASAHGEWFALAVAGALSPRQLHLLWPSGISGPQHVVRHLPIGTVERVAFVDELVNLCPEPTVVDACIRALVPEMSGQHPAVSPEMLARWSTRLDDRCPARSIVASLRCDLPGALRPARAMVVAAQIPRTTGRFVLPVWLDVVDGVELVGRPGWAVQVISSTSELARNAHQMRNCTATYLPSLVAGDSVILVVTAPDGPCFNASLALIDREVRVVEVNAYDNQVEQVPTWLRGSLERLVTASSWELEDVETRLDRRARRRLAHHVRRRL